MRVAVLAGLVCCSLFGAREASAQVDARLLGRAWRSHTKDTPRAFRSASGELVGLVELPPGAPTPPGLVSVAPGFAAFSGSLETFAALAEAHPTWHVSWAPPRRPLLDLVDDTTRAAQFRDVTGLGGKGVVVGIVDTGFDPKHADLLDANGKSRVAWVLDLSRQPVGLQPDLESSFGCMSTASPCSVLSGANLDDLLAKESAVLPRDTLGHGTHVTSLAAGGGRANDPPRYVGIAPEATIVVARVTRTGQGSILDPDVLLATRFIFERAEELGMPAVVNLSLGSDFGGHDGQTPLERGLAAFVGPEHPGRALVVAAGNSGGVYGSLDSEYPKPYGVHTEVHVPRSSSVRVPVLTSPTDGPTTNATLYVWIGSRPGDELEVGVEKGDEELVPPLAPGDGAAYESGDLEVTVLNQVSGEGSPIAAGSKGAVVVIDGTFASGQTFALRLEGRGTARLWVQSEGDLSPGPTSLGALFPRASKERTIGIPASAAGLISVGATLNRVLWTNREKENIKVDKLGSLESPKPDSNAYFSGAGPNMLGQMKPDIVAPGAFVIGAMSSLSDPKKNGGQGIFAAGAFCSGKPHCLVIDDFHAISSGTSMAAPIVTGAVALLFERDPTLTQDAVRTLLQAGARSLDGTVILEQQVGPGELDLMGTLAALGQAPLSATPSANESWIALAESYAHPDPEWPLEAVVELRAEDETLADAFDPRRLRLEVDGGSPKQALTRVAPGLWRFSAVAPPGSGGGSMEMRLLFDDEVLLYRSVPIAVDRSVADGGVAARGGCGMAGGSSTSAWWSLLALSAALWRRRRRWSFARSI